MTIRRALGIVIAVLAFSTFSAAQDQNGKCFFLCPPEVKIEPTFSWEHFIRRHRLAEQSEDGTVTVATVERERSFETVIAVDIPTTVPRLGFTFETAFKPFVKGTSPDLELELNFHWLREQHTRGWVTSHFDIVDQYSPGERPNTLDRYTHKLDLELDTAVPFLKWTKKPWLSDIEIETSIDYLATGLPRAGDRFGSLTYLDNASRWSFALVFVLPIAPLR